MINVANLGNITGLGQRTGTPAILSFATSYWKANNYSGSGDWLDLSGNGLNAQLGSSSGADTNDPRFLAYNDVQYMYLSGVSENYAYTPDTASLDLTGDIDLRAAVALDDWTQSQSQRIIAKWTTDGDQRSYLFGVNISGGLQLAASNNGINTNINANSTASLTVNDGELLLIRGTLDADNGAGGSTTTFYSKTSTEADAYTDLNSDSGWTQLGSPVTDAVYTGFNSTARLEIGSQSKGNGNLAQGKVYGAIVKDGIAGTTVFGWDVNTCGQTSGTDSTGKTVTINRSDTGKKTSICDRNLFLLGTDDYFDVADNALLDFADGVNFTGVIVARRFGSVSGTAQDLISKRNSANTTNAGYNFAIGSSNNVTARIADGSNSAVVSDGAVPGTATIIIVGMVCDDSSPSLKCFLNTDYTGTADTTAVGNKSNSLPLRIGGDAAGVANRYLNGEIIGAAMFRNNLSVAQMIMVGNALQT